VGDDLQVRQPVQQVRTEGALPGIGDGDDLVAVLGQRRLGVGLLPQPQQPEV